MCRNLPLCLSHFFGIQGLWANATACGQTPELAAQGRADTGLLHRLAGVVGKTDARAQTAEMFTSLNVANFERISISEFRKAPGKALRSLKFCGLILYSHSRISGYVLNKRMLDNLRLEVSRATRQANDLSEILRVLYPDLLTLRQTRPDLAGRIDSFLTAQIANRADFKPLEMVRDL